MTTTYQVIKLISKGENLTLILGSFISLSQVIDFKKKSARNDLYDQLKSQIKTQMGSISILLKQINESEDNTLIHYTIVKQYLKKVADVMAQYYNKQHTPPPCLDYEEDMISALKKAGRGCPNYWKTVDLVIGSLMSLESLRAMVLMINCKGVFTIIQTQSIEEAMNILMN